MTQGNTADGATAGLETSQWKYLSARGREQEMHVVLTVRVGGTGGTPGDRPGGGPLLAQVLVVDCSGSMTWPQEKFRAARQAAAAAIRMLPDGTPFAVVQGTEDALMAYPAQERMAAASAEERRRATSALHGLPAGGGTCIGAWLDLAGRLLAERGAPIGHVLLLTDGRNEHDGVMPLDRVLDTWDGRFVCDAWGIGDGWDARELLGITRRLHGGAGAVREESALPGEYEKLTARLLTKTLPELTVEVTPAPGTTVRYLKQVFPTEADLEPAGPPGPGGAYRFTTRAWGDETRRYQLCLSADPTGRPRHEDLQLAVVALAPPAGHTVRLPPPRPCVVHWTEDPALSRHTDTQVAHFQLYAQLGQAVAAAADAHRRGDREGAEHHLGRGVRLAHTVGAARPLADFQRLVEVLDATAGRVRLRAGLAPVDFEHLITSSSRSTYGPEPDDGDAPRGPAAAGATAPCPACGGRAPVDARFCPRCGRRLRERP
ncbi:VWA domain-containing protein [Streptomyces somaliensis DSM 40738]|uniref:VWA domain-containing protein n=1 Tax=Streptomyces somaliensis (strain ATCC 33201 / DSM 40738 / JCM 12659 / KCTC 9044 / NCTC 11332 / NRRL B-12077 / IP 733) TaxID=1134445 RepID=A0AA44DAD0_STRE0|nr:VWA domain-containing protein [Streptomyces somaliensis]MCQ0023693.1 VWA domain-containing protein [Streptomyces somaliensis DSM 40738]NKY13111.1 VWA domain-containing protein [Streptomyces somaliensis DSM 40738]